MNQSAYSAFTLKFEGIVRQLRTSIRIETENYYLEGTALWDTGASCSCISQKVANDLRLIPTGRQMVLTPSGENIVNTYLVNVILPNNVTVKDVAVCDSDIGKQGLDMLIGMDIITCGDMSITNYNGKTFFSFRVPSQQPVDFVMQSAVKGRKVKRK